MPEIEISSFQTSSRQRNKRMTGTDNQASGNRMTGAEIVLQALKIPL
jgi:hypothetical protein